MERKTMRARIVSVISVSSVACLFPPKGVLRKSRLRNDLRRNRSHRFNSAGVEGLLPTSRAYGHR